MPENDGYAHATKGPRNEEVEIPLGPAAEGKAQLRSEVATLCASQALTIDIAPFPSNESSAPGPSSCTPGAHAIVSINARGSQSSACPPSPATSRLLAQRGDASGTPQERGAPETLSEAFLVLPTPLLPIARPAPGNQHDIAEEGIKASTKVHRGALIIGIGLLILLLVSTVVGVTLATKHNGNEQMAPNPLLARQVEGRFIWARIASASPNQEWATEDIDHATMPSFDSYNKNSPNHLRALNWIIHDDPLQLAKDAENLLQRFYLVYFYFSTTADGPWTSCNPLMEGENNRTDPSALCYHDHFKGDVLFPEDVSAYTPAYEETIATRWLSENHECQWAGLFCNDHKQVEYLHLDALNLTGTFPPEAIFLEDLRSVSLFRNNLDGTLPSSLASLRNLSYLDFTGNSFTGTIPGEWWRSNLEHINLRKTRLRVGALPTDAGLLSSLEFLVLFGSGATGTIPSEFFRLTNLEYLDLGYNELTGTIDSEIGCLTNLEFVSFHKNLMSGTIPTEIGLLTNLVEVGMQGVGLTGTIPQEIYLGGLTRLRALILSENYITGTVSSNIARLVDLSFLYLTKNPDLVGTIPTELGQILDLRWVYLHRTGLTGSVPIELCNIRGERYLSKLRADCWSEDRNRTAAVLCDETCCTRCCDTETWQCQQSQLVLR